MIKLRKYSKVIVYSLISLFLYFFFQKSEKINSIVLSIIESKSAYGFGYLILFNLLKFFLLLFGIVGIVFFLFKVFTKNSKTISFF